MSIQCDCGEIVANEEDLYRCGQDHHRAATIRHARQALEDTPEHQRDDAWHEACAELERIAEVPPPRPPSMDEFVDLIRDVDSCATALRQTTGIQPTALVVSPSLGKRIRAMRDAFPGVFAPPPHARPMGCPESLGVFFGLEIFEGKASL